MSAPAQDQATNSLQCLDVWGGNHSVEADVAVTGLDVSIRSRTWHHEPEGGDIYLVSMCACAKTSRFMLADVAGHGQGVAPLARRLRKLMAKHINKPDQTRLAQALSREFSAYTSDTGRFATALLATYHPDSDEITICNAGHPPPLHYSANDARWCVLDPRSPHTEAANLPLGVVPGTAYHQFTLQLVPNDVILMLSDGISEASLAHPDDEPHRGSFARFHHELARLSQPPGQAVTPQRIYRHARDALEHDADDRTLLVLTHNGSDPPEQSLREKLSILGRMVGLGT